jgi:hypothetical protein
MASMGFHQHLHEETPSQASSESTEIAFNLGGNPKHPAMSDPFELRLHFSNRLRALNPCDDNTDEVVSFALRHRELDEDLHSCILEQLESVSRCFRICQKYKLTRRG